ncbi:MAG: cyclic nucleotide-binding domain-containing protein, partial [Lentisphaeraceae bacterium]|nr:cyclic nucleotide-binding domain-containing protein [Lentisphaeraceae bacterium]
MANSSKTIASLADSFPFDINTFKPKLDGIEVFDRGSENPEVRYSLKTTDEKYCVISEDEKIVSEMMDGNKTIDDLAAAFMEKKGRIALTMIRNFVYKLWKEGIIVDSGKGLSSDDMANLQKESFYIPLPGASTVAKILSPLLGLLLLNPLSVLALLAAGGYGFYILFNIYSDPTVSKTLFSYNGDSSLGLVIMTLTFVGASLIRFLFRMMLHSMYSINIKKTGIRWAQIVPGFFMEAPGVTTLKANSRFYLRTVGMIVNFGIAGTLLIILHHAKLAPATEVLLFQIAFYLVIYLTYQCCPILNNDLYLACADYLDEPYLRKASFSFVTRHFKRFFSASGDESGDSVIYMMFCAGVLFWITCTAQFLLTTLSQNSAVLNGLFSSEKSFSSWLVLALILLPVISGFTTSLVLIYKFSIKTITSQEVFKNTRNLIILSTLIIFGLVMFLRFLNDKNRAFTLILLTFFALFLTIKHSLLLSRLLKKSPEQYQYFTVPFIAASGLLYLIAQNFMKDNTNLIFASIILFSITSITFSALSVKIDWGEFIKNKRDSIQIGLLVFIVIGLIFYVSGQLQKNALIDFSFDPSVSDSNSLYRNRSTCLFAFILCGLSFILNIPGMVYKRGTQSFAPFFSIIFAIHLIFYFLILTTLNGTNLQLTESIAAASLLLAVGIGSYKSAVTGTHKNISTFPFVSGEGEKDTLIASFKYITENTLNVVQSDLGAARKEAISIKFNKHAKKVGWNWTIENPENNEADINVLGEQYNAAFQTFQEILITKCGLYYSSSLLKEIDDHLHAGARDIIYSRIPSFDKQIDNKKRHINLTFDKKKEIIDKIILFQDIKREELPSLVQCLQSVTYEAGDLIIKQHDEGDRLFILVEGSAQVEIEDMAGNSKVVSYLTGNEFFGEIALLNSSERTASVRATEDCKVLYLKRKD